jgi:hypothetical protein
MQIVEIGNLRMVHGSRLPLVGIIIECTKEEATSCSAMLYKDVDVSLPEESGEGDKLWMVFAERIAKVDTRLRKEKPSKRFTRDEVLAMLDEIDPEGSESAED